MGGLMALYLFLAFYAGLIAGIVVLALLRAADEDRAPRVMDVDVEELQEWLDTAKARRGVS